MRESDRRVKLGRRRAYVNAFGRRGGGSFVGVRWVEVIVRGGRCSRTFFSCMHNMACNKNIHAGSKASITISGSCR